MRLRVLAACVLSAAGLLAACSQEEKEDPQDAFLGFDKPRFDEGVSDGGMGGGNGEGGGGGPTETHLRLSFVKQVSPRDGSMATMDIWVYDFADNELYNATAGEGGVDCVKSCRVNPSMKWVGWLSPGEGGGFELWVAPIDTKDLLVRLGDKRRVAEQVNAFDFTNDTKRELIIYSKGVAMALEETIEVWTEPVEKTDATECSAEDQSACPLQIGNINSEGAFRVTDVGSVVILVRPQDLSSMTVDLINVRNGAQQGLHTFGEPGGTGSEFSGRLPVGLAPTAEYLAVFTRNEFVWRLSTLEATPAAPPPNVKDLYEVESNRAGDCDRPMPYTFNLVRFDPRFSPESDWIYFLAAGNCSKRSVDAPTNRDDHDILRIGRDLDGDPENVTNNPRLSHWINHDIGEFDLTPDGTKLAFTASRPNDAQSRSIWLIDVDGGAYDCSRGPGLAVPDGRDRCEFLFEEVEGNSVVHRNLNFHQVDVPR